MRVNIYAEEMTERVEIVEKTTKDGAFTGLRLYLELPVTLYPTEAPQGVQFRGPFMHSPDDDDSAAITFWGKRSMIPVLKKMIEQLEAHYDRKIVEQREATYARLAKPKTER